MSVEHSPQASRMAQVIWEILDAGGRSRVLLNLLHPLVARLESTRTRFPLGFVVWARK